MKEDKLHCSTLCLFLCVYVWVCVGVCGCVWDSNERRRQNETKCCWDDEDNLMIKSLDVCVSSHGQLGI